MSDFTPLENFAMLVHASRRPKSRVQVKGPKTLTWYTVWGFNLFFVIYVILNLVSTSFNN
jgi:hypothetical protein